MPTEVLMPALSPTMEEGKLAKWLVSEGDEITPGDVIAEIDLNPVIVNGDRPVAVDALVELTSPDATPAKASSEPLSDAAVLERRVSKIIG